MACTMFLDMQRNPSRHDYYHKNFEAQKFWDVSRPCSQVGIGGGTVTIRDDPALQTLDGRRRGHCYRPTASTIPAQGHYSSNFYKQNPKMVAFWEALLSWTQTKDAELVCQCASKWMARCSKRFKSMDGKWYEGPDTSCVRTHICRCSACIEFRRDWGCGGLLSEDGVSVANASADPTPRQGRAGQGRPYSEMLEEDSSTTSADVSSLSAADIMHVRRIQASTNNVVGSTSDASAHSENSLDAGLLGKCA